MSTALVIGSGGIGSQVCRDLAVEGHRVRSTYHRSAEAAEALHRELGEVSAGCGPLDATDPASCAEAVEQARQELGAIDILVITTGHRHAFAPFAQMPSQTCTEILAHELSGVMNVLREVLPLQQEAGFGRMVIVASDSGKAGSLGDAVSSAARGGVISLTRSLARETAAQDITVNAVCPGPTDTDLLESMLADDGMTGKVMNGMLRAIPKRRAGSVEEVSSAVVYLTSRPAGYITGQALSVSGGLTMV